MGSPDLKPLLPILVALSLLFSGGCAGTHKPPPPLWDSSLYNTVGVLPVRMTIATGRQPFTSEDTELSDAMGGKMQEALSIVLRYRGYEVLSPGDLSERLMKEDDLAEAFVSFASSQGMMGPDRGVTMEEGMERASLIGERLGADLLVLAYGGGEYHSAGENLIQGILTGLLSRGREQYQTPPSFLETNILFVDAANGRRIARFPRSRMAYEDDIVPLSRILDTVLWRVPVKKNPEPGIQDPDGTDKP